MLGCRIRRLPSGCLRVVLQYTTIIFEYKLRRRVIAPRERWLSILEFAVSIVQLQQKEVVLFEIQILCWFEVDGHIILNRNVESVR
jgi:hypothetical protein